MKNIIINLIPVKKGGGQQVARNFLLVLSEVSSKDYKYLIFATSGTEVHKIARDLGFKTFSVKNSILKRVYFEKITAQRIIKKFDISLVYTLFGPSVSTGSAVSVVGVAYSNLFFPEINFWNGSLRYRLKKRLVDMYRFNSIRNADGRIFENRAMLDRAIALYGMKDSIFIKPSIGINATKLVTLNEACPKNVFKVLMLTGYHPNKRVDLIPEIVYSIYNHNNTPNIEFIITINPELPDLTMFHARTQALGISNMIKFVGQIPSSDVESLVRSASCILLISKLESFSNNIIEAWSYRVPLVIADEEWSRAICGDAALYANTDDTSAIAEKIVMLSNSSLLGEALIKKGSAMLESYPTPIQKVHQQLSYLHTFLN